jgi:hypothetical protein
MEEIAAREGAVTERAIKYWGKRFRECLQTLAVPLGATGQRRGPEPRDKYSASRTELERTMTYRGKGRILAK